MLLCVLACGPRNAFEYTMTNSHCLFSKNEKKPLAATEVEARRALTIQNALKKFDDYRFNVYWEKLLNIKASLNSFGLASARFMFYLNYNTQKLFF